MIRRHHLAQRVIIHDHYIANEQIGDYLQAADLLVLPYRSGSVSGVATLAANGRIAHHRQYCRSNCQSSGVVARIAPTNQKRGKPPSCSFLQKK
jgi:hypothetical protein